MNALVSNVLTQVFITLIAVSGIYVLTGLTGMFSLGQAAFMAIGSYVSGLLVIRAHVPFALAALLAVAGATLIGYVIGYPVVRLRRDYISLVTLGFGEAIAALLNRMTTLTGGASGLTGIPRLVGLPLAFVSAVLAIALAAFFKTSKYGRQCIALKGDELAAKAKTPEGLTQEEREEQLRLRREYIDSVVGNLARELDNTYVVDEHGNKRKLRPKGEQ